MHACWQSAALHFLNDRNGLFSGQVPPLALEKLQLPLEESITLNGTCTEGVEEAPSRLQSVQIHHRDDPLACHRPHRDDPVDGHQRQRLPEAQQRATKQL